MADISKIELPNGDIHYFKDEYARSLRYELLRGIGENNILPFQWKNGKGVIPYNISIIKSEWNRPIYAIITNPYKNIRSGRGISGYADQVEFTNTNSLYLYPNGVGVLTFDINTPQFYDGSVFWKSYYGWPADRFYFDNDCYFKITNAELWGNGSLDYSISSRGFGRVIAVNNSGSSAVQINPGDIHMKCNIEVATQYDRVYNWFEYISGDTCIFNMDQYEFWNMFSIDDEGENFLNINVWFEGQNQGDNKAVSLYRAPANDPNNWTLVGTISDEAQIKWTAGNDLYFYKIRCSINNEEVYKEYICSYIGTATIEAR